MDNLTKKLIEIHKATWDRRYSEASKYSRLASSMIIRYKYNLAKRMAEFSKLTPPMHGIIRSLVLNLDDRKLDIYKCIGSESYFANYYTHKYHVTYPPKHDSIGKVVLQDGLEGLSQRELYFLEPYFAYASKFCESREEKEKKEERERLIQGQRRRLTLIYGE